MKTWDAAQESLPGDIRRAAIDLLARREHSRQELAVKLGRRFDNGDTVAQQLDDLAAAGLQSDRRFCEIFVRSKCQQGQGPQRISQELKQRGVDDALVGKLLWEADIDWLTSLQELYRRKYPDKTVRDQKERARRMRFLQYRGFGFDLILQVMSGD
jgi:regulatory protein